MVLGEKRQLENVINEVLKSGDVQPLHVFLQIDVQEDTIMKCSQQFVNKLDKLVGRSLDKRDLKAASLAFASLYKFGKNLKLCGTGQGLPGLITQGLIDKWFEKCKQLWVQFDQHWDAELFALSEDFFNALMMIHEACKEGTYKITESFVYPIGQLAVDPRVYILIQKEAIHKFNLILDKMPVELKRERKLLTSQESSGLMMKLAGYIVDGGDYDFQTSLIESLFRMTTPGHRRELADRWFSMGHIARAFNKICDSEFETGCRQFLNMVNGMHGDRRRVYSYPCLEVYLDKCELLMPVDEKLQEFWIDFNLGSHSISFYFTLADAEESHWEAISVNENEVVSYSVTEKRKRKELHIKMSEVVVVGSVEGSNLSIHFSSPLDILQAASSTFGPSKNRDMSAVKSAVEENNTQVVPESQVSLSWSEKSTAPYLLPPHSDPLQVITPGKMRISESTHTIACNGEGIVHGGGAVALKSSSKEKSSVTRLPSYEASKILSRTITPCSASSGVKPQCDTSIQSTTSEAAFRMKASKRKTNTSVSEAVSIVISGQGEEHNFVPDSQPKMGKNTYKSSISEMLMMPTESISLLPKPESRSSLGGKQERPPTLNQKWSFSNSTPIWQKRLHNEVTQRLQSLLDKENKDPPHQEPALPQKKTLNPKVNSKNGSSGDQRISSLSSPEEPQIRGKESGTDGNAKMRSSLEVEASVAKTSMTSMTKPWQKKTSSKNNSDNNSATSSKMKGDMEVNGSMVKLISSHYMKKRQATKECSASIPQPSNHPLPNRPVFNTSWLSVSKRQMSEVVSHRKTATKSVEQRKDVFAFSTDALLPFMGGEKGSTDSSATLQSGIHHSSLLLNKAEKGQRVEKSKWHVKKHLFSDTDTDNAATEVSWLRESNRKPKPKVTQYSRQAAVKTTAVPLRTSCESSDLLPLSPKAASGNNKPKKAQPKTTVKPATAAPRRPQAAVRRPRRATATSTKNYKEPETDNSMSDAETPPPRPKKSLVGRDHRKKEETCFEVPEPKKKKHTFSARSTKSPKKPESSHQTDLKKTCGLKQQTPLNVFRETSKLNKNRFAAPREQKNTAGASRVSRQTARCPSPPLIEKLRSAERSVPIVDLTCSPLLSPRGSPLPASHSPPCQDSPPLVLLPPKRESTVSSKGKVSPSSYYRAGKSHSKTNSEQSVPSLASPRGQNRGPAPLREPTAREKTKAKKQLSSVSQSPLSLPTQPLLTSTVIELDKSAVPSPTQSPIPEETVNYRQYYGMSKASTPSGLSLSQSSNRSSVLTEGEEDSPVAATEKTPLSKRGSKLHVSGPVCKRHFSFSDSEDDDEQEKKKSKMRVQRSPRMKPRKLFKSSTKSDAKVQSWRKQCASEEKTHKNNWPKDRTFKKGISEDNEDTNKSANEASALEKLRKVGSSYMSHWEEDEGVDEDLDMDEDPELPETDPTNLYQQFSSEIKTKFQNRHRMVEAYNKQSLKTVQHHVSSVNTQVIKHRSQTLGQVQKVLSEEISKLEQDDSVLKSMEKDCTVYWKKQTTTFHMYKKQEAVRSETLKKTLQSNTCHSLESEERIFTSQMCLMRSDMKSAQDRLLSKMQEKELESMKRGLHSLFFP